ncbi:MAG: DUF4132 domain-containing protein [Myxococcota bacterium]
MLVDEEGQPATLEFLPGDREDYFAIVKEAWESFSATISRGGQNVPEKLRQALRTGRTLNGRELRDLAQGSDYAESIWEDLTSKTQLSVQDKTLRTSRGEPAVLDAEQRLRLLHPARMSAENLAEWRALHPESMQLALPVHRPQHAEATSMRVAALRDLPSVLRSIRDLGFRIDGTSFRAPESNEWALLQDNELFFGMAADGKPPLYLGEVDPQFYSEAIVAVEEAAQAQG